MTMTAPFAGAAIGVVSIVRFRARRAKLGGGPLTGDCAFLFDSG